MKRRIRVLAAQRLVAICAITALTVSCAVRGVPGSFRLRTRDDVRVLVPPGVRVAEATQRHFDFRTSGDAGACAGAEAGIVLQPLRHGVRVSVDREELRRQPAGALGRWAASLERRGCVAVNEGMRLARLVAQSVPLAVGEEHRLLHASVGTDGYTDLQPGFRLRVVSPVFREGAPSDATALQTETAPSTDGAGLTVTVQASDDLIGYEIAWYAVNPLTGRHGARIVPEYADFHNDGEVERTTAPRANPFVFGPESAHFRLLHMTRLSESDRDFLLLAAATPEELAERTEVLKENADACEGMAPAGVCRVIARGVAILPCVRVVVNGREEAAPLGASLGTVLEQPGARRPLAVPPGLVVWKPHDGRLTRVEFSPDERAILSLPLQGGEEVLWDRSDSEP